MAFSREMFPQEELIISHRFIVFFGLPIKKEQFFWTKSTGPPVSQGFQHLQGDLPIIWILYRYNVLVGETPMGLSMIQSFLHSEFSH